MSVKKVENRTWGDNLLKFISCLFAKLKSFQNTTKSWTHSGILGSFGPDPTGDLGIVVGEILHVESSTIIYINGQWNLSSVRKSLMIRP